LLSDERIRLLEAYYRSAYVDGLAAPNRDPELVAIFEDIAARIEREINPGSILIVGCAEGLLVERFRNQGIQAFGICLSSHLFENLDDAVKPYCWNDFEAALERQRYDLIVSIEVLGYLPEEQAAIIVANCCQGSTDILFSSAHPALVDADIPPGNRYPDYWAKLFAEHHFFRDVDFDASFISPWAIRFRQYSGDYSQLIAAYERRFWLLWQESQARRALNIELQNLTTEKIILLSTIGGSVTL